MTLGMEIVKKLSGELDLGKFKDSFRERIDALAKSKVKGEVLHLEKREMRPTSQELDGRAESYGSSHEIEYGMET